MDISIIIAAHFERGYLRECIDSVKIAQQEFPGTSELILAFDGDYEHEVIKKYFNDFDIICPTGQKSNLAYNFNNAINNATGKYIKIFADDDLMNRETLTKLFEVADENNSDVVYSDYTSFTPDGKITVYKTPVKEFKTFRELVINRKIAAGTCLIKTTSFHQVDGFDYEYSIAEGYCLFMRMLKFGFKNFDYLNYESVFYRLHETQKSKSSFDRKLEFERILKKYNQ